MTPRLSAPHVALAAIRASGSLAVLPPPILFQAVQATGADVRLVMRQPASGAVAVVVFHAGRPTMVFMPGDRRSLGELMLAAGDIEAAALDALVRGRAETQAGLEKLLVDRLAMPHGRVQRLLDFQARARLLDVLPWREGFFELQEYCGGGETAFELDVAGLDALAFRAQARSRALPALLAALPAAPENTLVRRRRGGALPEDAVARDVHAVLETPLLVPQLVARLLLDDDLVLGALARLAAAKAVVMQPRVALAPAPAAGPDPRLAAVAGETIARLRGAAPAGGGESLTAVAISGGGEALRFLSRLGAAEGGGGEEPEAAATGLLRRVLDLGDGFRLVILAIRPQMLSRGALEGILARFDALVLVRGSASEEENGCLQHALALVRATGGREPLAVGVELGAVLRGWQELPDAILGLPEWEQRPGPWLVERLLDAMLAATAARPE